MNLIIRWRLAAIIASACVLSAPFANGQETRPNDPETALPKLDSIMDDLVEIRGLPFMRQVPSAVQTSEEFAEYLRAEIEETYPAERFADIMDGLLRLGLVKERFDLDEAFTNAIMSQAGAYYDPESGTFYYLMTDLDENMLRIFASHELVHALQDQHFDLNALMEQMSEVEAGDGPRNDDQILAIRCLVEGEATYVQTIWQVNDMMGVDLTANAGMEEMQLRMMANMDLDQMVRMAQAMMPETEDNAMGKALREMENIPAYILRPLYAAYMNGAYFTMKVRRQGGWDAVNDVWSDMPTTTEQCLHPEKYLGAERDAPTPLTLPEFAYLANDGWEEIDSAIHGELYLNLLLREQGDHKRAADRATEGWDGDIYRAWRNDAGDVVIALATTWDTEEDAEQFYKAYRRILPHKYENIEFAEEGTDRVDLYVCGDGLGAGALLHRGQEVFVVEGGNNETVSTMMRDLARMKIEHIDTVPQPAVEAAGRRPVEKGRDE